MSLNDYILDHQNIEWRALLRDWSTLLPATFIVWIVNRFGDLFIVCDDGSIQMLDIGGGSLKMLAANRDEFADKLEEDDNANPWLMIPLIDKLVELGLTLKDGECYSYKQPPILGGDYTVDNTCIVPIAAHFAKYASIYNQTKNVPDGTRVELDLME